ncbi:hypothetical protein PK98_08675 [Croceibacterium mercuriale]|uniref:PRC-barrel domain-containing protein n=1 Tax=Croceibacterium mercuriale TaxID=1572751 RepID=A0A0B2C2I8_9SPHN|nr:hypothetical protein [Croceibacterium mercuriale]KHL26477.1 hypothetical protein PK98_08675 [Croceibacterium mercuriale]
MKFATLAALSSLALSVAACQSEAEKQADAMEDTVERQADASAAASGDAQVALGLTERQLLDADLVTADGTELGDVAQVRRSGSTVEGLLVEIEDSNPDRYVMVPLAGLSTRADGNDTDVQTSMTAAQLAALPTATLATN